MILVRLRNLPEDSVTRVADGGTGWALGDYLTAHVYQAVAGEEHPWTPKTKKVETLERSKKLAGARKRRADREQAIAAGLIT